LTAVRHPGRGTCLSRAGSARCCTIRDFRRGRGRCRSARRVAVQVLLDERRAEMNVELHERSITDATKAMHLPRLDYEDVTLLSLKCFPSTV
jgi:hypothetical protein